MEVGGAVGGRFARLAAPPSCPLAHHHPSSSAIFVRAQARKHNEHVLPLRYSVLTGFGASTQQAARIARMQAHLAMALQRRAAELEQATPQLQRPRVIVALREPLARGAPTAAGWLCLAGLYRKDGNHSEALWAARMVQSPAYPFLFFSCIIALIITVKMGIYTVGIIMIDFNASATGLTIVCVLLIHDCEAHETKQQAG